MAEWRLSQDCSWLGEEGEANKDIRVVLEEAFKLFILTLYLKYNTGLIGLLTLHP